MEIATLCIAILALIFATVALTLTILPYFPKKENAPIEFSNGDKEASPAEIEEFLTGVSNPASEAGKTIEAAKHKKFEELMENPDARFTGIDEEFNI